MSAIATVRQILLDVVKFGWLLSPPKIGDLLD